MSIRSITVKGRWARVRTSGFDDAATKNKPIILMLHGITRSLNDWDPQFEALAGDFRLVALDLPGYGWSAPHPDGASLAALARGVGETIDALEITEPVHVAGNSLGGGVTMTLLTQRPELVASMTLVDSAGFGKEVTPLLRLLGLPVIGKLIATTPNRIGAIVQERLIFADKAFATRERIDHAMAIAKETEAGLTAWRTADTLGTLFGGVGQEWRDALQAGIAKTPRPTLVVWGDTDQVLPLKHFDAALQRITHAEGEKIPGVGHMPQLESAAKFNDLLSDFVRRTAALAPEAAASK